MRRWWSSDYKKPQNEKLDNIHLYIKGLVQRICINNHVNCMIVLFGDNTSNWCSILQLGACAVDGTCQTSLRISVEKKLFNAEPNHNVSMWYGCKIYKW